MTKEDEAAKVKTYLEDLINSMLDGLWVIDLDGMTIDVNPAMVKMLGYDNKTEIIKKHPTDIVSKKDQAEVAGLVKKTLEGKSCYGEVRIIRKDGKEVEVSINATSRKDCQGKAIGGFAILRDISEHKKAEKTITRAVEEWEKTFNAISDLIFIVDNDNVILKVNNAFAQILEMKPEEIVGNKCYELLHKRNAPWPKCPLEQTKKDGLYHVVEVNDPVISIPLLISTSPVVNSNGELIGAVHIAKDISERKEIEKELNKKLHALEVFQKAAVGRELKMVELKKKIKKLEEALSIAGKVSKEQRAKG